MPKGLGALLLGVPKKGSEEDEPMDTKGTAAKDVLAAVKGSDAMALQDALQRFYDACTMGEGEEMEG